MRIFEFYFNPRVKPDLVFESFCYEPENIYEKRVGSLYMVGAIKNALPKSARLLDELAKSIKDRYYMPIVRSPDKSLKESLKRANNLLEGLVQKGDVSWLGNLSFVTLTVKNSEFNFSKVGNLKTFLIRGKKIVDIDKKIKFEDIEPYPLKIFINIVSGKLAEGDIIVVLSEEVSDFFQKESLLDELIKISPLEERDVIKLLNERRAKVEEISGICLMIVFREESLKSRKRSVLVKPKTQEFSFKKVLAPILSFVHQVKLPKIRLSLVRKPSIKLPKISLLQFRLPEITIFNLFKNWAARIRVKTRNIKKKIQIFLRHKNTILITGLILLLFFGSFIFQRQTAKQLKTYQAQTLEIKERVDLAEGLLILNTSQSSNEALTLLRQAWEQLEPIIKIAPTLSKDFARESVSLEKRILTSLYQFNKLESIQDPELVFEFRTGEFIPQKIISKQNDIYFFSPYAKGVFRLKENHESQILGSNQEFHLAAIWEDSILFFSKPNQITSLKEGQLSQNFFLETPYPDFDFNDFFVFGSHLYFLDKKANKIVKYQYLEDFKWSFPQLWLNDQTQKPAESNSMAIDGSVWLLAKESINKYSAGIFKEKMGSNIFPYPRNLSKIFTNSSLPYLYVLEPVQNRIIIINKSGEIIKQFQSEKFDNLLDFTVSQDGKTIYLLNGLGVYKINF